MTSFQKKTRALVLAAAVAAPGLVSAASVGPYGLSFYSVPAINTSANGDLIWYRQARVDLGEGTADYKAWNVMYRSSDSRGEANAVTGTVIVPTAAWAGEGERPAISYAVGTHGLAQDCAPSLQLASGRDYETQNIRAAVDKGYAVLVTDYAGYTNGDTPSYLAGASQAHAALDIFRAASEVPGAGISLAVPAAVWGFSQGGQTAAWAGELARSYAPGLNLKGIASGGTPADFPTTAEYLNGSSGASFLLAAVVGLAEEYPEALPLAELTDSAGKLAIAEGKRECVFEALFSFMNDDIQQYTANGETLDQLLAKPEIYDVVAAQNLGDGSPSAPIYQYHGKADEFIPIEQHVALKRRYCSKFADVTFDIFPSEHIVTQFQAAPYVLDWLGDRFEGKWTTGGSCASLLPAPKSTANPGGGDFVVSLDQWSLDSIIYISGLDQYVTLPTSSTMTAESNITQRELSGSLDVPNFDAELRVLGLNMDIALTVQQTRPIAGSISLTDAGRLVIDGDVGVDIKVRGAGFGFLKIPFSNCHTSEPVEFPLNYYGPIAELGGGKVEFVGEATFPEMEGCGLLTSLFTALMSGPGQEYSFRIDPPAPRRW